MNSENKFFPLIYSTRGLLMPIPVAARSKAWVYGGSLDGIDGSNPAEGIDVCLLWVLCGVK
jgi:hypothetical protein